MKHGPDIADRTADLAEHTQQAAVLAEQAALLDLAQDAIFVRDMNGRIVFWNRGAAAMYGWPREEALGRDAFDLLKAECFESSEDIETTLLKHGRWEGESVHYAHDGARIVVECRLALQRDGDGAASRVLAVNTDITCRRQAESDMERLRQEQLTFKSEFLSHVSHELRSPLTAIKQSSSILLGGLAGDLNLEQREYQETVLKNVRQLQAMIDDLLEVTRLDHGQLTIAPERVAITEAVDDAIDALKETARSKGISLLCNLAPDLPAAHADQSRLRQVLTILLDNAITFTPDAGAVSIQAGPLQDDPRFVLFEVSDSGSGINPDVAERIFERLYQVAQTEELRKGLGLGLHICKQLVTRQGGRIWVQSCPENGTTFSFTLPVFSVDGPVMPVKSGRWPAESVAIMMVEVCFRDAWDSREAQQEWSRETRRSLERHVLPDIDVLVPKINTGAAGEHFCFVAAVVDERGAAAIADRIRTHFERLPQVQHPRVTVSVSYRMLQTVAPGIGASMNSMVATMAAALEDSINSHIISEAVCHEQ